MAKIIFNDLTNNFTGFINQFENSSLINNKLIRNKEYFNEKNFDTFAMSNQYNARPDIIAYKVYGDEFLYPVILFSNKIGSIVQFTYNRIGDTIFYLKPELLPKVLS